MFDFSERMCYTNIKTNVRRWRDGADSRHFFKA